MITERPMPLPDDATTEFWQACQKHELRMQRCASCKEFRWPPRPMCGACQSFDSEWIQVSGRGTIYSYVIAHAPMLPAFAPRAPFPIILVALDEDPAMRMIGNLIGDMREGLQIGAKVTVAFEEVGEVTLPQWKIVGA